MGRGRHASRIVQIDGGELTLSKLVQASFR